MSNFSIPSVLSFAMTVDLTDVDDFTASLIPFLFFKMEMNNCGNLNSGMMATTG